MVSVVWETETQLNAAILSSPRCFPNLSGTSIQAKLGFMALILQRISGLTAVMKLSQRCYQRY